MKYKLLSHTADIKFAVSGKTINEIFENSVLALSEFISKSKKINSSIKKEFIISAKDNEELFYKFIDELIYLLDAENFVCSKAKIKIEKEKDRISLNAVTYGDKTKNYKDLESLKAATYSEMYIKKDKNGWRAQAVVDI